MNFSALLYDTLRTELRVCKLTNDRSEIIIRCVYCGDSVKNDYSAHFYIQAESPYFCYCQRCSVKSAVSVNLLKDFGINNRNLIMETMKMEKDRKFTMGISNKKGSSQFVESVLNNDNDFKISDYVGTDLEFIKLEYLNNRLGLSLTLEDAKNNNIILNFKEFMLSNEIKPRTILNMETLKMLQYHSIGFLSQDKNFIVFRSIDTEITNWRYYNYNITGKRENTRKYFTIPSEIDLLDPDINIVITEGIIDLFSVYYNVYEGDYKKYLKGNTVFVATNGIGMNLVINTVSKLGFLSPNILIYSDSEVKLKMYKNIKRNSPFLTNSRMTIHYNLGAEDFGVPKDKIQITYSYL